LPAWQSGENRFESLEVVLKDGDLYRLNDGEMRRLIPVDPQHFRDVDEPGATMAFVRSDGVLYFQSDDGNFRKTALPGNSAQGQSAEIARESGRWPYRSARMRVLRKISTPQI